MSQLPHSIELHDSTLSATQKNDDTLVLMLRPTYVHKDGKGWRQDADIIICKVFEMPVDAKLPCEVSDGTLKTLNNFHQNLLILPLMESGPVDFLLELTDGTELRVVGTSIQIKLHGEPDFIETIPQN